MEGLGYEPGWLFSKISSGALQQREPPNGRLAPLSTLACARGPEQPPRAQTTRTLVGFKSPCTMAGRRWWRYCSALAMSRRISQRSASGAVGRPASAIDPSMYDSSDTPSMRSRTIATFRPPGSTRGTMAKPTAATTATAATSHTAATSGCKGRWRRSLSRFNVSNTARPRAQAHRSSAAETSGRASRAPPCPPGIRGDRNAATARQGKCGGGEATCNDVSIHWQNRGVRKRTCTPRLAGARRGPGISDTAWARERCERRSGGSNGVGQASSALLFTAHSP